MPINHEFVSEIDPDSDPSDITTEDWNDDHVMKDSQGNIHTVDDLIIPNGFVNVKDFGAMGDGITNDLNAVMEALAACPNVYFPEGTYICNLDIEMGNFNLLGAGKFLTVLKSRELVSFKELGTTLSTSVIGVDATSTYIDGWSIKDLSIVGIGAQVGIEINGNNPNVVTHGVCENLEIEGCSKGIWTHGNNMDVYKNIFQNIRIIGCTNGIYRDANGAYDIFKNMEITMIPDGGYAIYEQSVSANYENVSVDGCIYNSGSYNRFLSTTVESINATTPPSGIVFQNLGNFTMIDLSLIEIDPAKCTEGYYTNNIGNVILSLLAVGTLQPTFLMLPDTDSSGSIIYAYGGSYILPDDLPITTFQNWSYLASPFFGSLTARTVYFDAIPTTGSWNVGDKCYNTTPTAGGYEGWICITAGTPGTWKGFGLIQT